MMSAPQGPYQGSQPGGAGWQQYPFPQGYGAAAPAPQVKLMCLCIDEFGRSRREWFTCIVVIYWRCSLQSVV